MEKTLGYISTTATTTIIITFYIIVLTSRHQYFQIDLQLADESTLSLTIATQTAVKDVIYWIADSWNEVKLYQVGANLGKKLKKRTLGQTFTVMIIYSLQSLLGSFPVVTI